MLSLCVQDLAATRHLVSAPESRLDTANWLFVATNIDAGQSRLQPFVMKPRVLRSWLLIADAKETTDTTITGSLVAGTVFLGGGHFPPKRPFLVWNSLVKPKHLSNNTV